MGFGSSATNVFDEALCRGCSDGAPCKNYGAGSLLSHRKGFPNWPARVTVHVLNLFPRGRAVSYSGEGYIYLQTRGRGKSPETTQTNSMDTRSVPAVGMTSSRDVWRPDLMHYSYGSPTQTESRTNWEPAEALAASTLNTQRRLALLVEGGSQWQRAQASDLCAEMETRKSHRSGVQDFA